MSKREVRLKWGPKSRPIAVASAHTGAHSSLTSSGRLLDLSLVVSSRFAGCACKQDIVSYGQGWGKANWSVLCRLWCIGNSIITLIQLSGSEGLPCNDID